jgi:hypothetical protein
VFCFQNSKLEKFFKMLTLDRHIAHYFIDNKGKHLYMFINVDENFCELHLNSIKMNTFTKCLCLLERFVHAHSLYFNSPNLPPEVTRSHTKESCRIIFDSISDRRDGRRPRWVACYWIHLRILTTWTEGYIFDSTISFKIYLNDNLRRQMKKSEIIFNFPFSGIWTIFPLNNNVLKINWNQQSFITIFFLVLWPSTILSWLASYWMIFHCTNFGAPSGNRTRGLALMKPSDTTVPGQLIIYSISAELQKIKL